MSLRLPCAVRQTSALLRLPRNTTDARNRTFKSKFPTTSLVEQHDRSIPLETATRELTVDSQQQPPHEYTFAERPGAKAAQVHVRLGLEDMKDADRGQQPTVWAVARAEDSSGKRTCQAMSEPCVQSPTNGQSQPPSPSKLYFASAFEVAECWAGYQHYALLLPPHTRVFFRALLGFVPTIAKGDKLRVGRIKPTPDRARRGCCFVVRLQDHFVAHPLMPLGLISGCCEKQYHQRQVR